MTTPPKTTAGRRHCRGQSGFSLVEMMVGILVCSIGMLAVAASMDVFRTLMTEAAGKTAAAHVHEREIERLRSLGWDRLAMTGEPDSSADTRDPRNGVSGSPKKYRPDDESALEPFALDAADGQVDPAPTDWEAEQFDGQVHRFVTWGEDANGACDAVTGCVDGAVSEQKRVTVAVTYRSADGDLRSVVDSVIVVDPEARPTDVESGGSPNPDPVLPEGSTLTYYLHDTPASFSVRQAITGDHTTHDTTVKPDLMGTAPPPSTSPAPSLYKYSTDVSTSYPGGAIVNRSTTGCSGTTRTQRHRWATPVMGSARVVTGTAAASIYTATRTGTAAPVKVCLNVYEFKLKADGTYDAPKTKDLGSVTYSLPQWPAELTRVSFPFAFRTISENIEADRRLGVQISVDSSSGDDVILAYDHQNYDSWFQFETTPQAGP